MDGLPIQETVDVDFKSKHDNNMHDCGYDVHTTVLYSALVYLMHENPEFSCRLRLMFQPGEEGVHGAKHMINEGNT